MRYLCTLCLLFLISLAGCEVVDAPPPDQTTVARNIDRVVAPERTPSIPVHEGFPVLPADELLALGLAARAQGDYGAADFSQLLQYYPTADEAPMAQFYLAESYARRGRWTSAAELFGAFLATAPAEDPLHAPALFWLARAHEEAGAHEAAITTYQAYRELATPIEPYAALRQAAQERALGLSDAAIASWLHAARTTIVAGERAGAFEKAIALLVANGRNTEALALYEELLELAEQPAYRARILSEAAALAASQGQPEQARRWLLEVIERSPATALAGAAVDQLRAAGDPALDPAAAGAIYFTLERWADAVALFDQAIPAATDAAAAIELRRMRGLALRAQGDFAGAIAGLADAAALAPDLNEGRQARLDLVQTIGQSGETEQAIAGYTEFAAGYPDDPRAPVALDRAAQLRERLGDSDGALQTRRDLGQRYPASDEGRIVLHTLGLELFRAGQYDEARQVWGLLAEGNDGLFKARGSFWAGRAARALGDEAGARALFAVAREAAPDSYEGVRAAEELGAFPQGSLALNAPITDEAWAELAAWVALLTLADEVADDPVVPLATTVSRTLALEAVGLQVEAMAEWRQAINRATTPLMLMELGRAAHEAGAPYPALLAAEQLKRQAERTLNEASVENAPEEPVALQRLRFPTPYATLIDQEATAHGIDSRLFLALVRQESLFNPGATSWVGARGLGQVMPATGQGIAQNLGVTDFVLDDLYQPAVSIRFGTFYLGQRLRDMQGSIHGALASYNGGLGNAQRWAGGAQVNDPDLFTEAIDYPETKGYVRAVYTFWGVYQRLYAASSEEKQP